MDRQMVYPGQIPLETDVLSTNKDCYIGLAKLTAVVLGTNTSLHGFACSPTNPPSLEVQVGAGEIYSLQNIDNSAYSTLQPDTTHQIVKQGVNLDSVSFQCPIPGTPGNSINYLIEISFSEVDGGSQVLPYYNASNPAQAWSGPNNSGQPNFTIRQNQAFIQIKAGIPAPTGTQATPGVDAGCVGAWVVTVANEQTSITAGNITLYPNAPFISETLPQKISQITADARYLQATQVQNNSLTFALDTSSIVNTLTASISPNITVLTPGLIVYIKVANTNTSAAVTLNLNGTGAKEIIYTNGGFINPGDLAAGHIAQFIYNGESFELVNPANMAGSSAINFQTNPFTFAVDTSTQANQITIALNPAITNYTAGLSVWVRARNNSFGASTLNINGVGNANILNIDGSTVLPGQIRAGMVAKFFYDGAAFQLLNPGIKAGQVEEWAGSAAPDGYFLCDGRAISRTDYAPLFTAIGTSFGSGDGSSTFNIPDYQGRTSLGTGQGAGLTTRSLGQIGGEENHTLNVNELAGHDHDKGTPAGGDAGQPGGGGGSGHTFGITGTRTGGTGGGQPHNNMQPFIVINKIIKY